MLQIHLAGDCGDEGVDEALEEPLNDGAEGCADDDSDGEVNNVAPHHEILETLEHGCEFLSGGKTNADKTTQTNLDTDKHRRKQEQRETINDAGKNNDRQ